MIAHSQILLQTKLHQPHLPQDLVLRTRLVELLNQAISRQITLVCAPAGFGKTTLISTWLQRMSTGQDREIPFLPSAWLSLDENDNDLNIFLRYFIAALRTIFTDACEETLSILKAQQQPPLTFLFSTFSNELEQLPREFIFVLDDYQFIHKKAIHNLLIELTRHWPKPLHLILISRISPTMPLASLRAKGVIQEIRTQDLRFNRDETSVYLQQSRLTEMSPDTLQLLEDRFEGWPAGLHLAVISLRSNSSQETFLKILSSENSNITGYLVDEVLNKQLQPIRSFLIKTSILDRFCAPLCEAVIGESSTTWNARACLDWIESAELFIVSLDDQHEWYRYHHLFQELLQKRLSAELTVEQLNSLHATTSAWFEEQGLVDESIRHALLAGDLDMAARQMNGGLCDLLNRGDQQTLERWLSLLPEEMIQGCPELLMFRVWAKQFLWQFEQQAEVIQQVEELMNGNDHLSLQESDQQTLLGQIIALKGQQAYYNNQHTHSIELSKKALELLPASWTYARGGAMLYLGMSMQARGEQNAAEQLLLTEYETYGDKTDAYGLYLLVALGLIYLNTCQLEKTKQIGFLLLQGATRSGLPILLSWANHLLGLACYQRNELETATQHFSQNVENRYTAQATALRDAFAGLVLIHQIRGESAEAWQLVETISQIDLEQRGIEDSRTRSLRARLMLLQGDILGAGRWADTFTDLPPDRTIMWLEEPQVTRASILIARGTKADLRSGVQVLDCLEEIADRTHNTRYKIIILVLRSLALDALGQPGEADDVLKEAINLAQLGGDIRAFTDQGRPMKTLLTRLLEQGHSREMIHRIVEAFPEGDKKFIPAQSAPPLSIVQPSGGLTLIEPLTPRELEILKLLRGPSSIKEIALQLNISYETVRRHIANIYGKLGVNQRWDAIARAEELNILLLR